METTDTPAEQHTPTSGTVSRRAWWGVLLAVVLIAGAFVGGFFAGRADRPDPSDDISAATTAACRTWEANGTDADLLAARLSRAVARSGFIGNPGRRFAPVVTAARTAAATPGLDDKTFATFTELALRADRAKSAITPYGGGRLDQSTLSAYQDALAAVAITCHTD